MTSQLPWERNAREFISLLKELGLWTAVTVL